MFIDTGSMVIVRETSIFEALRGQIGFVRKIRIDSDSANTLVFVEMIDGNIHLFDPCDLARHVTKPATCADQEHEIALRELLAA